MDRGCFFRGHGEREILPIGRNHPQKHYGQNLKLAIPEAQPGNRGNFTTTIAVIRSSDDRIVLEGNKAFTEE